MQDIIFYVSAKEALGVCKDSLGVQDVAAPAIILGSKVRLRMRLLSGDGTDTPLPIAPLAACVSWEFVMDSDWNHNTPLKVIADNANIAVAAVTETDSAGTEHTYTEVQIPVISINSAELQALLTAETVKLNGELAGYDADAELAYILQIKDFTVRNRIAASGPPTETEDMYLDAAEVRALVSAGFEHQFAATDSAEESDWHSVQADTDEWCRSRLRGNASAAWGDAVKLLRGPQGVQGETGPQGVQGETGPQGADGIGFAYQGEYSAATIYAADDAVTYGGSLYVSLASVNTGNAPDASPAYWELAVSQGEQGIQGDPGEGMTDAERARLLPDDASGGDLAICREGVDRGNNANTRLLVQPIEAGGSIADSASGNAAPVGLVNYGVTVDENGDMVFNGTGGYIDIGSNKLPDTVLDVGKEWTLDILFYATTPKTNCFFGYGGSPRLDFLLSDSGGLSIGGGPDFGSGWSYNTWHLFTFELYLDGGTWKWTGFRNGAVVASGTWGTAAWRASELTIGADLTSYPYRNFAGKMRAVRIEQGATHRGQAFTPLALPWLPPAKAWEKISAADLRDELSVPAPSPLLLDYTLSGASVQLKIEASATADFAAVETLIDTGLDRADARLWDATAGEWVAFPAAGVSTGARVAVMMDNIDATALKYLRYKWYAVEAVSYIVTSVGENVIELAGTYTGSGGTWLNTDDSNPTGRGWLKTSWAENSWALGYQYNVTEPEPATIKEALYVATGGTDATDATWSTSGGTEPVPTIIKTGGAPADFDSGWIGGFYPAAKI